MEPVLPTPQSPEQLPAQPSVQGETPSVPLETSAAAPTQERVGNQYPVNSTPVVQTDQTAPQAVPPPVSPPLPQDPAAASTASPMIADDVDVMEKEWVDKAKKIVQETKDDPHQQGKEVSKLQADYLMKRYNKQIKLAE